MNKIELTKTIAGTVVGLGTSKVVHTIIKTHVQPVTKIDKITVAAASLVIGSMASNATKKETEAKIDKLVAWYNENKNKSIEEIAEDNKPS